MFSKRNNHVFLKSCLSSVKTPNTLNVLQTKVAFWTFLLLNVCEKVLGLLRACDRTEAGQGRLQTEAQGRLPWTPIRPSQWAGSGIVAGPDRVRGGVERPRRRGRWVSCRDSGCPRGSRGATHIVRGRGRVSADFHGVQMLNMQMSDRIVRRWIGPPSWLAWGQSAGSGAGVSRAQPRSPGQNEQPLAGGTLDVWTWIRLYLVTTILIDSNVCLSGAASDICHLGWRGLKWKSNRPLLSFELRYCATFLKDDKKRKKTSTMSLNGHYGIRFQVVVCFSDFKIISAFIFF